MSALRIGELWSRLEPRLPAGLASAGAAAMALALDPPPGMLASNVAHFAAAQAAQPAGEIFRLAAGGDLDPGAGAEALEWARLVAQECLRRVGGDPAKAEGCAALAEIWRHSAGSAMAGELRRLGCGGAGGAGQAAGMAMETAKRAAGAEWGAYGQAAWAWHWAQLARRNVSPEEFGEIYVVGPAVSDECDSAMAHAHWLFSLLPGDGLACRREWIAEAVEALSRGFIEEFGRPSRAQRKLAQSMEPLEAWCERQELAQGCPRPAAQALPKRSV